MRPRTVLLALTVMVIVWVAIIMAIDFAKAIEKAKHNYSSAKPEPKDWRRDISYCFANEKPKQLWECLTDAEINLHPDGLGTVGHAHHEMGNMDGVPVAKAEVR